MPERDRDVAPGPDSRSVKTADGRTLRAPEDWSLLPPGDAGLTRRVKKAGPSWTVKEQKGRRSFSRGVWAPTERIERIRAELALEREDPAYQKRLDAGRRRREREQEEYGVEFERAIYAFLDFSLRHHELAERLARAICAHAVPVGSGTVARTKRIPIERRAEAATIAWLRHQTTGYDSMSIARVKGRRREVRRMLAERSRELLADYRNDTLPSGQACPLEVALERGASPAR